MVITWYFSCLGVSVATIDHGCNRKIFSQLLETWQQTNDLMTEEEERERKYAIDSYRCNRIKSYPARRQWYRLQVNPESASNNGSFSRSVQHPNSYLRHFRLIHGKRLILSLMFEHGFIDVKRDDRILLALNWGWVLPSPINVREVQEIQGNPRSSFLSKDALVEAVVINRRGYEGDRCRLMCYPSFIHMTFLLVDHLFFE